MKLAYKVFWGAFLIFLLLITAALFYPDPSEELIPETSPTPEVSPSPAPQASPKPTQEPQETMQPSPSPSPQPSPTPTPGFCLPFLPCVILFQV